MKYEDQIFNLSADAYLKTEPFSSMENEEVLRKQAKLLTILFKKFKEELESKKGHNQGILKVKFRSQFFQDPELGYCEIEDLIKSNNFDSFASQYCFYLGSVKDQCDEYNTAYYEIIWDYKTYFEQLSMQQIDISSPSSTGNNFTKAIKDFKQLPINYQIDILNSFAQCVEDSKKKNEHDIAVNTCSTEGHVFSKWKKIKYSTKEEYWDAGPRGYVDVEHVEWKRTCTRCGFEERIDYEPQELIEERLEKNKQAKIKRLEKKLEKLKNE